MALVVAGGQLYCLHCMNYHFGITQRLFLSTILLSVCLFAYCQNDFMSIYDEVKNWYANIESSSSINPKSPKTVDFSIRHYSITGVISKGILQEGTIAKFYETSSLAPNLLLEGKVSYNSNRLVIDGIKHESTQTGMNKIYGSFYVYNMEDFSMNYKAKKAGDLRIKCQSASYLEGFYLQCPVIVKMLGGTPSVYVDGKTGERGYSFLSAKIPGITLNEDDSFDIFQMLFRAKDDITMCWEDGVVFNGSVKPTMRDDNVIIFNTLTGQRTGMTSGPKKITVSRENGNIVYSQEDNDDNPLLQKEALYVKDNGELAETDYWNVAKIYELCYRAQWTYRNGNYFEGAIKTVITPNENTNTSNISSTATKGVFKYPNGDRFEGDVSTKTVSSFFVDGTTFFADGSKVKGNWLEKYKLTSSQWKKIDECQNPSDALALAQKFMRSNYYPEYTYPSEWPDYHKIEYFDPIEEQQYETHDKYITYDKTNKRYSCRYEKTSKHIDLVFTVNEKGYRKWEVIYKNGTPTYLNEYSWYSNGIVESIKSYHYSTKKIYLACYFFSDGKLRSAYQYGRGNSGENILRKSKESHPTLGGYSCKLYDLNGNYERSIEWKIGTGESLWGQYVQKMAPSHLVFGNLKPIEIE